MNTLTRYEGTFEGQGIVFHIFRGRVCVIAAAVGRALGYGDDGKSLVEVITKQWADEVITGGDFDVLTGAALREFKASAKDAEGSSASSKAAPESGVSFAARLMILYESGVDLVCIKTEKPAGRAMRRWLADEVLPKLRRGEQPALPGAPSPAAGAGDMAECEIVRAVRIQGGAEWTIRLRVLGDDVSRSSGRYVAELALEVPAPAPLADPVIGAAALLQALGPARSTGELAVLLVLVARGGGGPVVLSRAEIAADARCSERSVFNQLVALQKRGIVSWEPGTREDGGLAENVYTLNLPSAPRLPRGRGKSKAVRAPDSGSSAPRLQRGRGKSKAVRARADSGSSARSSARAMELHREAPCPTRSSATPERKPQARLLYGALRKMGFLAAEAQEAIDKMGPRVGEISLSDALREALAILR